MQTAELFHDEGQEAAYGKTGAAQVLQILPDSYSSQRDKVAQEYSDNGFCSKPWNLSAGL
jgi:hypothetical protein